MPNKHIQHIEELVYSGYWGMRKVYGIFNSIQSLMSGYGGTEYNITQKFDGSVAVICGIDPADGKFFVGKKSVFNKEPIVYKSFNDIDDDITDDDLAMKMKYCLKFLPELNLDGIYQGDLLYVRPMLSKENIESQNYIVFQPNTIAYAVPANSPDATAIANSRMGIVFHTKYNGHLGNLQADYKSENFTNLSSSQNVFVVSASINPNDGGMRFDNEQSSEYRSALIELQKKIAKNNTKFIMTIKENPELILMLKTFDNYLVRNKKDLQGPAKYRYFERYVNEHFDKQIAQRKSSRGQQAWGMRKEQLLGLISNYRDQFIYLFELNALVTKLKKLLIDRLSQSGQIETFLKKGSNYKRTGHEGFVFSDSAGNTVKLVNRMEFSHANFSDEYSKGFVRNSSE